MRQDPGVHGRAEVTVASSNLEGVVVALEPDLELSGTFRISGSGFAPGRYLWDVTNLSDSAYVKLVRYSGADVTRSPIDVAAGGKLEIVLSGKAGSIARTLRNDKSEPLNGVTVTVWPKSFNPGSPFSGVKSRSTDRNGSFKIGGLAPGDYYAAAAKLP